MKDILGRELKQGDPVVCMAVGRNSSGMHFGIQTDTGSVITLNGTKSSYNRFLVTNPSPEEQDIIDQINKKIEDDKIEKQNFLESRKAKKAIPYKDLQFCHIYEDDKGDDFIFLGNSIVTINVYEYGRSPSTLSGYLYIPVYEYYDCSNIITDDLSKIQYLADVVKNFRVRKTRMRLVKDKGLHSRLSEFIIDGTNNIFNEKVVKKYSYFFYSKETVKVSINIERIG